MPYMHTSLFIIHSLTDQHTFIMHHASFIMGISLTDFRLGSEVMPPSLTANPMVFAKVPLCINPALSLSLSLSLPS